MTDPPYESAEFAETGAAQELGDRAQKAEANFFKKTWENGRKLYEKLSNNPVVRAGVLTALEFVGIGVGGYTLADVVLGADALAKVREGLNIWSRHSLNERGQYVLKGFLQAGVAAIPLPISGIGDKVIQNILPIRR